MLKYRILSGTTLIAVFGILTFRTSTTSSILFLLLASFFLSVALTEFFALTVELGHPGYPLLTTLVAVIQFVGIGIVFIVGAEKTAYGDILESFILFSFVVILFIRVFGESDPKKGVKNLVISLSGFVYLCWSMSFMLKLYFLDYQHVNIGPLLLFYVVTVTKCADIGGYVAGKLSAVRPMGNHKLAPRLSPKKSWEGLAGGVFLSTGISCLLAAIIGRKINICGVQVLTMLNAIVLAVLFSGLGLLGDLSVSVLKRAANQKDSGVVIPGFGGTLDLLDSLILVLPFYYCFLKLYKI